MQDKYLNRENAQKILDTRPPGTNVNDALEALAKQGFTIEDYNDKNIIQKAGEGALNVGKTILGAIAEPSARLGQTAGAGTIAGINTLTKGGDFSQNYQDASKLYEKSGNIIGNAVFGESVQPDQNAKQVLADVGQTAVNFLPYNKIAQGTLATTGSKLLGQMAAGGAGGYLVDVSSNLRNNSEQPFGTSDLQPGIGTTIGLGTPLAFEGAKLVGRTAKKIGTNIVESVLPKGTQEAGIVQAYKADTPFLERVTQILSGTENAPQTIGKTATENTLLGTKTGMGIKAKRAQDTLWKGFLQPALDNAGVEVNLPKYFDTVEQQIIASTPEQSRQKALLEALNSFREDYAGTNQISLAQLQKLKEGWAEFVPEKFYRGQNIAGTAKQVSALLADQARQTIYDVLGPEARTAYLDYGNLKSLAELGKTEMTNQKLKGGAGSLISDLVSRAVTPIGTIGGQVIYRVGQGLEFIGNAGANTLNQALGLNSVAQDIKTPITTEANQTVNKIKNNVNNMSGSIPQTKKGASGKMGGFAQITKDTSIPKELQPLAEETRKYKSAEEFVKNGLRNMNLNSETKDLISQGLIRNYNIDISKGGKHYLMEDRIPVIKKALADIWNKANGKKIGGFMEVSSSKIPKNIEGSVVQIVDTKTGKDMFFTIPKGQLAKYHNLIDDTTKGVAGKEIDGKIYHLTAKTPKQMLDNGFVFGGHLGNPKTELGFLPKAAIGTAVATGALKAGIEYKKSKNK